MADIVLMPRMNLEMIEGVISYWAKQEGDPIHKDEVLCEVENEKETSEVFSSYEGIVVKHICEEGETCPVNKPLCIVAEEGEDWQQAYTKAMAMKNEVKEGFTIDRKIAVHNESAKGNLSPKLRRLLKEHDIALEEIEARFPDVKITEAEIVQFAAERHAEQSANIANDEGDVREHMSSMRSTIAKAMLQSCQKTARLTNFLEVDMTGVVQRVKATAEAGVKLSYTAIVIKACALAMDQNPIIDSVLDEAAEEIVFKKAINIGCAVDYEAGLVVPVIQHAERKTCLEITEEIKTLAQKVRDKKLTAEERSGGTFTVSSIGMYDADFFTPIINYPQTAILGVGRIKTVPRYADESCTAIEPHSVMEIGLTYDHRVIDGGPAMKYLLTVRDILENNLQLF